MAALSAGLPAIVVAAAVPVAGVPADLSVGLLWQDIVPKAHTANHTKACLIMV
jgi:hypothetical protein